MKPLSKGDTCKVRLHTGEVVEAVYDEVTGNNNHFVEVGGKLFIACKKPTSDNFCGISECRFVGPACALVPVGVSV